MNQVFLMGRLTADPEIRYTQTNNTKVANFNLAVNRRFVKEGQERQSDFLKVIAWNKLGEFCEKYLHKGTKIVLQGRIETRTWDDDNGVKHYATEIIAENIEFAESKKTNEPNQMPTNDLQFENSISNQVSSFDDEPLPF